MITHEVNNPLSGVLIYSKLLYKKLSNDDISRDVALSYLSKMNSELVRATELIHDLKYLTRKSKPKCRKLDINETFDHALEVMSDCLIFHGIRVVKNLDPSPPKLEADFEQLSCVLCNLFLNAIQSMPKGGQLTLISSADSNFLTIEIEAACHAIEAEADAKKVTSFSDREFETQKSDLELEVAGAIVQRHGGNIGFHNQPGKSNTVFIKLPIWKENS